MYPCSIMNWSFCMTVSLYRGMIVVVQKKTVSHLCITICIPVNLQTMFAYLTPFSNIDTIVHVSVCALVMLPHVAVWWSVWYSKELYHINAVFFNIIFGALEVCLVSLTWVAWYEVQYYVIVSILNSGRIWNQN